MAQYFTNKERLAALEWYPGREKIKKEFWFDLIRQVPYTKKVTITLADLNALGAVLVGQIDLIDLPAGCEITSCWFEVTDPLVGPGLIAPSTMSVGPTGSLTALQTVQSVLAAAILTANGTDLDGTARAVYSTSAATQIEADFSLTGCNADALTAGEIDVYFEYVDYSTTPVDTKS
jgi:hypothetical protein